MMSMQHHFQEMISIISTVSKLAATKKTSRHWIAIICPYQAAKTILMTLKTFQKLYFLRRIIGIIEYQSKFISPTSNSPIYAGDGNFSISISAK